MQIKQAKKQSDPKKTELLLAKKQWNGLVKVLIAKLIAFKRGINGRGDDDANLPKVRVREQFPSQYGTYLNSIAGDYDKVIQGAQLIMRTQNDYSSLQSAASESIYNLKVASWWGSRLWAKFSLLSIPKEERKLRLSMIAAARETIKKLRQLEYILTSNDPDKIAKAAIEFVKFSEPFLNTFVEDLVSLINFERSRAIVESAPSTDIKALPAVISPPKPSDQIIYEEVPPPKLDDEYHQLEYRVHGPIEQKLTRLFKSVKDDKTKKHFNQWHKRIIKGLDDKVDINVLNQQIDLFEKQIDNIVTLLNKQASIIIDDDIIKVAQTAIQRWIRRKLMEINPEMMDQLILKIVSDILSLEPYLNKMMNHLENSDALLSNVLKDTSNVLDTLKSVARRMFLIADHFYRTELKPQIREKTLRAIKNVISELNNASESIK